VKGGRDQIRLEEACRRELRGSGSLPWRPIRVRGASSVARVLQKKDCGCKSAALRRLRAQERRQAALNQFLLNVTMASAISARPERVLGVTINTNPMAWYLI
jgi:hypothetical protein